VEKRLVSICVGTYQHSRYIKECLDSLLSQKTNFPFEIILGEDQSTDGTREICIEYANKYPEIIKLFLRDRKDVIYIEGKATGRFNFIQNLKACEGKYIALCDGDDYWTDINKLQKQIDFLEANPDFSICFHSVLIDDDEKEKKKSNLNRSENDECYTIEDLAEKNLIHTPSVVYRNMLQGDFPSWFKESSLGDYSLHMLVARHGKIKYFSAPMAAYRKHGGGTFSPLKEREILLRSLKTIELLLTEDFTKEVNRKLIEHKRRYINTILDLNFNHWDYEQFRNDIKLVESDDLLMKYWLLERLPLEINNLRNSRAFSLATKIGNLFKLFKK